MLDNFCWGYTDRPETLGSLVRAALACHDLSIQMQTPFISGKDSLHNEFSYTNADGQREVISIPSTLLISAMGQVNDVRKCVTMDLKAAGNLIYQVGQTFDHLAGSHWSLVTGATGGAVPTVDGGLAKRIFHAVHASIQNGLIRSCHDLSEGGLATAVAEMAFAGGLGAKISIDSIGVDGVNDADLVRAQLFSESNTRFVVEVLPEQKAAFEEQFSDLPLTLLGTVDAAPALTITSGDENVIDAPIDQLKNAWQNPLDWS